MELYIKLEIYIYIGSRAWSWPIRKSIKRKYKKCIGTLDPKAATASATATYSPLLPT